MKILTKQERMNVQKALNARGYKGKNGKSLTVDGIDGEQTQYAIIAFKKARGLLPRAYVGPITYAALISNIPTPAKAAPKKRSGVPWVDEMMAMLGKHEDRDNAELIKWLKSDGTALGDPSVFPWCGDGVETALKRALGLDLVVPKNPYLAANWNDWGESSAPFVGAIAVFWRGSPASWQGHIGFIVGASKYNWYVLGCNQSDSITITPISKERVRKDGIRCPAGYEGIRPAVPAMSGGTVSTNEA